MAIKGWPSKIGWGQFQKLSSRPSGHSADAHTEAQWRNPPGKKFKPVKVKDGWRLDGINLIVSLVKDSTWVLKGQETEELLNHEQGHWDITGLIAREWHGQLEKLRARNLKGLKELFKRGEKRLLTKSKRIDKKYDDETNHGRDPKSQAKWDELINSCIVSGSILPES